MPERAESGDRVEEAPVHDLFSQQEQEAQERTRCQEHGHTHEYYRGIGVIRRVESEI